MKKSPVIRKGILIYWNLVLLPVKREPDFLEQIQKQLLTRIVLWFYPRVNYNTNFRANSAYAAFGESYNYMTLGLTKLLRPLYTVLALSTIILIYFLFCVIP